MNWNWNLRSRILTLQKPSSLINSFIHSSLINSFSHVLPTHTPVKYCSGSAWRASTSSPVKNRCRSFDQNLVPGRSVGMIAESFTGRHRCKDCETSTQAAFLGKPRIMNQEPSHHFTSHKSHNLRTSSLSFFFCLRILFSFLFKFCHVTSHES